jgi:hypothetical protein
MRAYRSIVDPTGKRKKEQRKVKPSGEVTIMDDEAPALICRLSNTGTLMHRITSRHVFNATIFGAWRLSGTRLRHGTCSRLCKPAAWSFPEGSTLLGPSGLHLFSLVIDTTSSRDSGCECGTGASSGARPDAPRDLQQQRSVIPNKLTRQWTHGKFVLKDHLRNPPSPQNPER